MDSTNSTTSIEGKWADIGFNSALEFHLEQFEFKYQDVHFSGKYSQTNNTITFNVISGWIWDQKYNPWTATYKFEDNNKYSSVLVIANLIGQSYVIHGKYRKL